MNAITKASPSANALASIQSLKQGLSNVAATMPTKGGDPFLRMGKDGEWMYGAENVEVEEGSLWAVNPMSLQHGFACWTDYTDSKKSNELVGERMVQMTAPLPGRHDLPDTGEWNDRWTEQLSFQLKCVSGEDKGEQALYKTTSVGGIRVIRKLIDAIMAQLDADPSKPVPVIVLDSDSYPHKKWGKIYTPVFDIKHWASFDAAQPDVEEPEEVEEQKVAEVAKPTRTRASSTPKVKPEEPKAEPVKEMTAKEKLLAQIAALDAENEEQANNAEEVVEQQVEQPAADALRRRRRVA